MTGCADGCVVGCCVGWREGRIVGCCVGCRVGCTVGCCDGWLVGSGPTQVLFWNEASALPMNNGLGDADGGVYDSDVHDAPAATATLAVL
jgi:hypothetical protein